MRDQRLSSSRPRNSSNSGLQTTTRPRSGRNAKADEQEALRACDQRALRFASGASGRPRHPPDHAPSAHAPSALVTRRTNNAVTWPSVCGSAAGVPLRLRFARRFNPLSAPLSPLADRRPKPYVIALTDRLGDAIPPDVAAVLWCGRLLPPTPMPWAIPSQIPERPFCCPILPSRDPCRCKEPLPGDGPQRAQSRADALATALSELHLCWRAMRIIAGTAR